MLPPPEAEEDLAGEPKAEEDLAEEQPAEEDLAITPKRKRIMERLMPLLEQAEELEGIDVSSVAFADMSDEEVIAFGVALKERIFALLDEGIERAA